MREIKEFEEALKGEYEYEIGGRYINDSVLRAYETSSELEYIDFDGDIWAKEDDILDSLKEFKIKTFTYSSTSNKALATMGEFVRLGVKIKGMTRVRDFDAFILEI